MTQCYLSEFLDNMFITSLDSNRLQYFRQRVRPNSPSYDPLLVKALGGSKAKLANTLLKVWYTFKDVRVMQMVLQHARRECIFGSNLEFYQWLSKDVNLSSVFQAMRDDYDVEKYVTLKMFKANPVFLSLLMVSTDTSKEFLETLQGFDSELKLYTPKVTACDYDKAFPQLIQCLKIRMAPHVQCETLGTFFDTSVALNWAKKNKDFVVLSLLYFRNSAKLIKILLEKFQEFGNMTKPQISKWIMGSAVTGEVFEELRIDFPEFFELTDICPQGLQLHPDFLLESYPKANHRVQHKMNTMMKDILDETKDARFVPWVRALRPELLQGYPLTTFAHNTLLKATENYWQNKEAYNMSLIQRAYYCITTKGKDRTKTGLNQFIACIEDDPIKGMHWGELIADYLGVSRLVLKEGISALSIPTDLICRNRPIAKWPKVSPLLASKRKASASGSSKRQKAKASASGSSKRKRSAQEVIDVLDSDDEAVHYGMVQLS
jgi:hypothetical protein